MKGLMIKFIVFFALINFRTPDLIFTYQQVTRFVS